MAASLASRKPKAKASDPKHNQNSPDQATPKEPVKTPEQIALEKAEAKRKERAVQLRSIMHQYREADNACKITAQAHKENMDAKSAIAASAKGQIGIPRKSLDGYLADMMSSKRDLIKEERQRREDREDLGIVTGEQMDLFGAANLSTDRDEAAWMGEAFSAGLRFDERKWPDGMPERFNESFFLSYDKGAATMRESINASTTAEAARRTADLAAQAKAQPDEETPAECAARERAEVAAAKEALGKLNASPDEVDADALEKGGDRGDAGEEVGLGEIVNPEGSSLGVPGFTDDVPAGEGTTDEEWDKAAPIMSDGTVEAV